MPSAPPPRLPASPTAVDGRPHVLVVDDEEDLCELIGLRLRHNGFHVTTRSTVRAGIEALERESIDALVLDLRLESENGMDLLVEVARRSPHLAMIVLTADGGSEIAGRALALGAFAFLTKPFDPQELVQMLHRAVTRSKERRAG